MIQPETKLNQQHVKKSIKKRMNYVRKLIKIKKRAEERQAALDKINDLVKL